MLTTRARDVGIVVAVIFVVGTSVVVGAAAGVAVGGANVDGTKDDDTAGMGSSVLVLSGELVTLGVIGSGVTGGGDDGCGVPALFRRDMKKRHVSRITPTHC